MLETVEDFEATIKELSTLKAPGVSGSRIKNLKDFFLSHVDEEDKLVGILINGCKNTPLPNKLGPLYVVDAIVRSLIDEIGSNGAVEINDQSPNGTAAAAVYKIQTNIEDLLNDAIPESNDDVKERISKLIDIWIGCSTFNLEVLTSIKDKYYKSFTPPGTPPRKKSSYANISSNSNSNVPHAATNQAPSVNSLPPSSSSSSKDPTSVLQALANLAKNTPSPKAGSSAKLASPPNNNISPPSSSSGASTDTANSSNPNAIFQLLQNMNKMSNSNNNNNSNNSNNNANNRSNASEENFRDRSERGRNNMNNNDYARKRDRSPDRSNPKPTHVEGERNEPSNPHYRVKKARIDKSVPQGCINVYSRTIFIGGVPHSMDEHQLVQTLRPYAEVQSVILNTSRKHAFVKVYSRNEAEQVIQAFSVSHPSGLRARWGVGFGPRDCCNYQTGVSTIPIQRLTDADRKWLVQAEWGGTLPELPLQPGLFVEEPDIEVGHGVSSKSISRKMPTNSSHNGPKSDNPAQSRYNNNNNNYNNYNNNHHNNNHRFNSNNPSNMPMNFGNPMQQQGPPPSQPYPNMMPFQQGSPPQHQGMMNQPPYPPQQGMMGSPASMSAPFNSGSGQPPMDQTQMMAAMMSAMSQMQQGQQGLPQQPNNGMPPNVDMNSMFQVMANMMNGRNQQPPPSQ